MRSILFLALFFVSCSSCAIINLPEVRDIIAHKQYKTLSNYEKDILEDILEKALKSDRKEYYLQKLILLLDTQTNSPSTIRKLNKAKIHRSVKESEEERREIIGTSQKDIEEYMNEEELYEKRENLKWASYQADTNSPHFYVSREKATDILVHIRVRVHGDSKLVEDILSFEDAIEKHLYVPGFSVNIVFVNNSRNDIFEVNADSSKWVTSHNWSGGYKALAHELMHLMGLPDEYDMIEAHADNQSMKRVQRLIQFEAQIDDEIPADAKDGIMCSHWLKPLERHVCAAVGLGELCVQERMETFQLDYDEE